jgi:hypothetical protein
MCCIIMHNMIIQDKVGREFERIFYEAISSKGMWKIFSFHELNVGTQKLKNMHTHFALWYDIMNYLWQIREDDRY